MKRLFMNRQAGVGHLGLILGIVVVLAIGGVGYFVFNRNSSSGGSDATNETANAVANAVCSYSDKDLCKFFKGFSVQKYYTMEGTSASEGETGTMLFQKQDDNVYLKMSGGGYEWETMSVDGVSYTKASTGTWWKEAPGSNNDSDSEDPSPDITEPVDDAAVAARYKLIGKEACGNLTCFKYQELYPDTPNTTAYIWFDDDDYLMRRYQTTVDGQTSDFTLSYAKLSLKAPSPMRELQPGQFIFPGAAEPTSL